MKAHSQFGVMPLVQRTSDLQFHAVFITGANSPIHSLQDLKGRNFAFGDINSTSGHLMPYLELKQIGINPDTKIKFPIPTTHPATPKPQQPGPPAAPGLDER